MSSTRPTRDAPCTPGSSTPDRAARPRRWLVVTSSFPLDPQDGRAAAGLFVADFAQALAARGHAVTVVTPSRPGEKATWPGLDVRWLPWSGGAEPLVQLRPWRARAWRPLLDVATSLPRRVAAIAREVGAEVVLAFWAVPGGWWALGAARPLAIPVVTWCLGTDVRDLGRVPVARSIVRHVLQRSDVVLANSHALADLAVELAGVPCGFLPASRVVDRSLAGPLDREVERPFFYYLGRFLPVKGPDVLVEAMLRHVAAGGRGTLVMHGGGPMLDGMRARVEAAGATGRILFEDYVPEARAVSYLAACDVRILPSRAESMPISYMDALQMGRPLIVTDVGDMGRLMREQDAGILVPPEDPAALAAALGRIERDGVERYREAVARAAADLDVAASAAHLEEIVASLPATARARRP